MLSHLSRRLLCSSLILCAAVFSNGCARGLVKEGPTGDSGKGIGLKIPVLGFARKDSYDAENLSTGNLKQEELNPFQEADGLNTPQPLSPKTR